VEFNASDHTSFGGVFKHQQQNLYIHYVIKICREFNFMFMMVQTLQL
jgi:hypothetical protein